MVQEVVGDLLECNADFICHQTNFYGVMGGGVARAIWDKLMDDNDRYAYQDLCCTHGRKLLGTVQHLPIIRKSDEKLIILLNLFCQDDSPQADGGLTRYDCMRSCLEYVERHAKLHGSKVALPGYMGCGIAGGNWQTVRKIIEDVFGRSPVSCTIVHLDKSKHDRC